MDDLFLRFPITGKRRISCGEVPVPYHVYDGEALLIGGYADLGVARELLAEQALYPIATRDGRALAALWVCDFSQASLGVHQELQVSLVVSHQPLPPVAPHPLALIKLLLMEPQARLYCQGLWNNTRTSLCYNREILGLDAREAMGAYDSAGAGGWVSFRFQQPDGALIAQGDVLSPSRQSLYPMLSLAWLLKREGLQRLRQADWLEAHVVNPAGEVIPHNADAQAYLQGEMVHIDLFDPENRLIFGDIPQRALNFSPQFIEFIHGFKFVYLHPYNQGGIPLSQKTTSQPARG
jgi:hypothetical protein